ncbi:MAG: hypothetical protein KGJ07_07005 [Patescibacteria group bacterium]|nr:hypothetical protein [Patescibacteria group bacterium]
MRKVEGGFAHWCPGCKEMHILPEKWTFDGNLETPTFAPSFKHRGLRRVFANGEWTGEWVRDTEGNTVSYICHYVLTAGVLNFCDDSTHALSGKSVPLPDLPGDLP